MRTQHKKFLRCRQAAPSLRCSAKHKNLLRFAVGCATIQTSTSARLRSSCREIMAELTLHFLGPLRIERAGVRVEIDTRKALAALAYLAVGSPGGLNSRDHLATLLYPDYSQDRSRSAFRRTLSALRSGVGSDLIQADRETVSLALDDRTWCDVLRFQSLSDQCKSHGHAQGDVCVDCLPLLEQAAGLYSGDFMAGFSLRDSLSFDDWQFYQAENSTQRMRQRPGAAGARPRRGRALETGYRAVPSLDQPRSAARACPPANDAAAGLERPTHHRYATVPRVCPYSGRGTGRGAAGCDHRPLSRHHRGQRADRTRGRARLAADRTRTNRGAALWINYSRSTNQPRTLTPSRLA